MLQKIQRSMFKILKVKESVESIASVHLVAGICSFVSAILGVSRHFTLQASMGQSNRSEFL